MLLGEPITNSNRVKRAEIKNSKNFLRESTEIRLRILLKLCFTARLLWNPKEKITARPPEKQSW